MKRTRVGNVLSIMLFPAVVALSASCDEPCFCTGQSVGFEVLIIDDAGNPVPDLDYSVTVNSTGQLISFVEDEPPRTGQATYMIVTDLERHQLDGGGDRLHFAATNGQDSVMAEFEVDAPGSCHCHIQKLSGPDTLVIHLTP